MNKTTHYILMSIISLIPFLSSAQEQTIKLFPHGAPGETVELTESIKNDGPFTGGKPVMRITNVSTPEITIYPAAKRKNLGAAMIVCPGGGYQILAYDLEGTEICEWLNNLGITAVLLKYRVPRRKSLSKHEAPLQDVQRAISYIRAHAKNYDLKPDKIGIMGFSAGAHLSVMACNSSERTYAAFDTIDEYSCKPNFCLLVYPAYLSGKEFQLASDIKVTSATPPTILIQAEDDIPFINSSLFYYYALKKAGVPATLHIYDKGGHGYGIRNTGAPVNEWPQRASTWFKQQGFIK